MSGLLLFLALLSLLRLIGRASLFECIQGLFGDALGDFYLEHVGGFLHDLGHPIDA